MHAVERAMREKLAALRPVALELEDESAQRGGHLLGGGRDTPVRAPRGAATGGSPSFRKLSAARAPWQGIEWFMRPWATS